MTPANLKKNFFMLQLLGLFITPAYGQDENITYDPSTESYIYRYRGYDIYEDGRKVDLGIVQSVFTPAKVVPKATSIFQSGKDSIISYRYKIANGRSAKNSLSDFTFGGIPNLLFGEIALPPSANEPQWKAVAEAEKKVLLTPKDWEGRISRSSGSNAIITWQTFMPDGRPGIAIGSTVDGFGYGSLDLPGIVQAEFTGQGESIGFEDSNGGPAETSPLREQNDLIHDEDYKPYPVAAPVVVTPKPFDAAVMLDHIRAHVATWPSFKTTGYNGNVPPDKKIFLLDPAFAAQLDRYLAAAADAFRHSQFKAAKEHLETIHEMLEKEHKHLDGDEDEASDKNEHEPTVRPNIDRLAARVLDFDLKYVLKRMERDEDEHKKK